MNPMQCRQFIAAAAISAASAVSSSPAFSIGDTAGNEIIRKLNGDEINGGSGGRAFRSGSIAGWSSVGTADQQQQPECKVL